MDNYIEHELFMKNPPSQLTPEGLVKLNNAYKEELKRIKEIYHQEKTLEGNNENTPCSTSQLSNKNLQQFSLKNSNGQSNTSNIENPVSKRQRVITTDKEKEILNPLLLKNTMPTKEKINNILKNLLSAWDNQRVKRYYNNNKITKKKLNDNN
ncbi:hypothetical protein RhiirA1_456055 [Rhizophagus irregularis]|uniref:Uncharacterized protein n=1 Tax=Rhizophagus irregularis TaxID=588596 RepID=A0A2I1F464_9GLOM|nr:hypothetical protein RhiirA1_456055 [Rhizophagus irregularis]PKY29165.1 hypothetical protein RhiirB3_445689 [Rhizophagus irregularis]CAB5183395.1 unnamed protein product [Rhizophagus irregularis]